MDNEAFEMQEETFQGSSCGHQRAKKEEMPTRTSLLKLFLLFLLACALSTALGVLTLALVFVTSPGYRGWAQGGMEQPSPSSPSLGTLGSKFQFLNHLGKAKVYRYPGGEMQWARFRQEPEAYDSEEQKIFGRSLNSFHSKMTFGTLRIKPKALRAPHWHLNANLHGYLLQGTAWLGLLEPEAARVSSCRLSAGQVIFIPSNTLHWLKNLGAQHCLLLLFFSTHEELQTLELDEAFWATPEDISARALRPRGGLKFIRSFQKQAEGQAINLPPNLQQLVHNATYPQSPAHLVWRYFYDLQASAADPIPGGEFHWARYRRNSSSLNPLQQIFSSSLHQHKDTLTLATLRIFSNGLGQPHFHSNANEMGYVISGCGQVGVVLPDSSSTFTIGIGDVLFFPMGTQHYIKSICDEDLLLLLAYSTGDQLQTLGLNTTFRSISSHILAQLFHKAQVELEENLA